MRPHRSARSLFFVRRDSCMRVVWCSEMADPNSGIPADGISFSKAFERVFDTIRPDAGGLRAAIECALEGQPEHDEIWARFQAAIVEVDVFFRNELACDLSPNTLIASSAIRLGATSRWTHDTVEVAF
jgi:hypothetical protein